MKHFCGTYKGYNVRQEGQIIGHNWYGKFYATKNRRRVKGSECGSVVQMTTFLSIINDIPNWKGTPKGSSTPYEFFVDYIRDYYTKVSLKDNDAVCKMLKEYYDIEKFYAND